MTFKSPEAEVVGKLAELKPMKFPKFGMMSGGLIYKVQTPKMSTMDNGLNVRVKQVPLVLELVVIVIVVLDDSDIDSNSDSSGHDYGGRSLSS